MNKKVWPQFARFDVGNGSGDWRKNVTDVNVDTQFGEFLNQLNWRRATVVANKPHLTFFVEPSNNNCKYTYKT